MIQWVEILASNYQPAVVSCISRAQTVVIEFRIEACILLLFFSCLFGLHSLAYSHRNSYNIQSPEEVQRVDLSSRPLGTF